MGYFRSQISDGLEEIYEKMRIKEAQDYEFFKTRELRKIPKKTEETYSSWV